MALNRLVDNNAAQPLTLGTLRVNEGFTSYGQTTLWAGSQSGIGLIVRQALQTQGADIQQWQAADGAVFGRVNSSGEFHHGLSGATARFGTVTPIGTAVLVLSPPAAAYIGLVIRGFAGQTGDIQQWQNSAGTTIGKIDSAGNLVLNATGTGSIQLGDATITKTSGSSFFFNSGGNFTQQVSISSGNLVMKPIAYAGNQSGGITMTDAGGNWSVGGFYLRSDGSGVPRFAFVPPQTALEVLTLNGNQVGINTSTPGTFGSGSVAAQLAVNNFTANGVGLVVRAAGSQTANLQEWQNSSGTARSFLTSSHDFRTEGYGAFGSANRLGSSYLSVVGWNATDNVVQVRGVASQTGALQQWQNSSGTVLASVSAAGDLTTSGLLSVTASSGDEGGEIRLAKATTNTTIDTAVNIDIFQNKLRFWESGGSNRGYYVDITSGGAGASTNLSALTTGAMNYAQTIGTKQSAISSAGTTIVSVSITTTGYPVHVTVTGDMENNSAGGWVVLQLYRGATAIGNPINAEASAGSENVPYALSVVDTPSAGTYTYALKLNNSAGGTFNFGESNGPVINAIELSGPKGDTASVTATNLTIGTTGLTTTSGSSPWNGQVAATIDVDTTKVPLLTATNLFTGLQTIQTSAAGNKGLIVKASASQSANLFEAQDSSGNVWAHIGLSGSRFGAVGSQGATFIDQFGNLTVRTSSTIYGSSIASISTVASTSVGLTIRAVTSQTANIQEWQNSSGTILSNINSSGKLGIGTGSNATVGDLDVLASAPTVNISSTTYKASGPKSAGIINFRSGGDVTERTVPVATIEGYDEYTGSGYEGSLRLSTVANAVLSEKVRITNSGYLLVNTTAGLIGTGNTLNTQFGVLARTATTVGAVIRGASSQTASLTEWQNSAGTVLSSINTSGAFTGSLSRTNTGQVGSIGYTTPGASSQATWANYPVGFGAMIAASQAANGTPTDNFQYFFKVAVRDVSNGWGGLSIDFSTGDLYVGNANDNTVYASWIKQASTFNANTFNNTQTIIPSAVGNIGLIVKGRASQTANLQEWQDSAGTVVGSIAATGAMNLAARLLITAQNSGSTALFLQAWNNIHNADLMLYRNSAGGVLGGRNANAQIFTGVTGALTTAVGGTIQSISASANPTVTMASAHGLANGDRVTLTGTTGGTYNGTFIVSSVASTTFVITSALTTGQASAAGTALVDAQTSISARSAATTGIIVRAAASQSSSMQEWQQSDGAIRAAVSSNGHFYTVDRITAGSFNTGSLAQITSNITNAGNIGLAVRGAGSQSANLTEWLDSTGTVLAKVNSIGVLFGAEVRTNNTQAVLREVGGGGNIFMSKATSAPGAPGTGIGTIYFRDGTNAGTLKLVVRAGSAGAEVTILDNIPQS